MTDYFTVYQTHTFQRNSWSVFFQETQLRTVSKTFSLFKRCIYITKLKYMEMLFVYLLISTFYFCYDNRKLYSHRIYQSSDKLI